MHVVPQDPTLAEGLEEQLVRAVCGGVIDREDADTRVGLCRERLETLAEPLGRVSDREDNEDRRGGLGRRGVCRGCTHARITRAASLAPSERPERKRGPGGPLPAIVHRRSALLRAGPLAGRRLLGGTPLRGALLGRGLLGRPPLGRRLPGRLLGRAPLRRALLGGGLLRGRLLPSRGLLPRGGLLPSCALLRRGLLASRALLRRDLLPGRGLLGRPTLRSALLRAAPLGHRHVMPPFVPSPFGLSGRHAFQAPPFPFAHTPPHAVPFIAAEGVVETLDAHGTLATEPLGLPR